MDADIYPILSSYAPLLPYVQGTDVTVTRIYPGLAPQDTAEPYIVFEQLANQPITPMTDRASAEYRRYAINAWATERSTAQIMADLSRDAFEQRSNGRPFGFIAAGKIETFDIEVRLWCVSFDWGIWVNR